MAKSVNVGPSDSIPEGGGRQCDAGGKPVAVFRTGGVLHAVDGTCCHRGGPLGEGTLDGCIVSCPWHGWRFDVRTGQCVGVPGKSQAVLPVREEGGQIFVEVS